VLGEGRSADAIVGPRQAIAAWLLEAAEADIEFTPRRFRVTGTDRSLDLFAVAAAALRDDVPEGLRGPLAGVSDETVSVPSFPYGCAVCEVEVDPETGVVEVPRYTSVDDCGRAVNPMILHGQTHGGIAAGVGQALWEQCVYGPGDGAAQSATLMDYVVPRADRLRASRPRSARCPRRRTRSASGAGARAVRRRRSAPSSTRSSTRWPSWAWSTSRCRRPRSASGAPSRGAAR